jgi:hypothetical protein
MGRPSLGQQAKTIRVTTKISAREKAALEAAHGTVYLGLRAALDAYLVQPQRKKKPKAPVVPAEPVQQVPEPVAPAAGVVPCRIHRSYRVVRRWVDRGQEWTLKRCEDCGTEVTVLDHG